MSSGRRTPHKACYFGRFCHNDLAASPTLPSPLSSISPCIIGVAHPRLGLTHVASRRVAPPLLDLTTVSASGAMVVPALASFPPPRLIWWFNLYFIRFLLLDSYLFIESLYFSYWIRMESPSRWRW